MSYYIVKSGGFK